MVKLDRGDGTKRVGRLLLRTWSSGGLSVEGPLAHKAWCLAVLDEASCAVRGERYERPAMNPPPPAIPGDVATIADPEEMKPPPGLRVTQSLSIGVWDDGGLSVEGPILDQAWCLAAIANAKDAVRRFRRRADTLVVPPEDVEIVPPLHPLPAGAFVNPPR